MASLWVRNVDEALVQSLRERAAAHGRSVEAEHCEMLAEALRTPTRKTFAEVLMIIQNVGEDADFARVEDREAANVSGCRQRIGEI
ncbi:DNA-binding protein [Burkholderia multivorans]|uniref:FitA-like ribbon-helix-helix domain-containing protein n=1 Tax=Burkholderia multivorans TaxID=87883 RepID=UPI0020191ED8|nr:DNA-binding protein [Burkholderia multivorans]MCO1370436.1 DNA-binding protein [Burkholderia multivorans]MCO1459734.1 DNA-binding protein [Burkholderia multivorans]MCO1467299.1 DNA-binding protein [Burkholderia multivorans]UQO20956.1 DNA-binding protein [Burkholderia multivorans]UQO84125.1 DNA-binding protein [Burkholderia multivorans]